MPIPEFHSTHVEVIFNGVKHKVIGANVGRSTFIWIQGKQYTPFAQRIHNIQITFQGLIALYMPDKLLLEEMQKPNCLLKHIEEENNWLGGTLVVPFKASGAK